MGEQAAIDAIKSYDHIPDPQEFKGISSKGLRISADNNYGEIRDYPEDPQAGGVAISHEHSDP